ncbi:integrase/recombinase XerD [Herbaspirillum sp. Sphag1AN]|uniref:tyrosine-type recombinase/integrase n=1 Tax=unclassified Herbaspirillum TaxID=2624150 RepID=UPI001607FACE|nr:MULTISPECIES: tyrosine-type recombinase/integrase [unclassified Herbaspirillum]MBB3211647.1 integrase/recombinase XerD [Herbaspirillum sp. Sphag1AN]MBB3245085.1 integrase/recombinase XerD [Herbaspirillum sp. Sphag64]
MVLSEAASLFLKFCEIEKKLSPYTLSAYRGDLLMFGQRIGLSQPLSNFSELWINDVVHIWRSDQDLKASTVKRRVACIKVFARWLFQHKFLESNCLERLHLNIKLPKRLPRHLQTSDMKKLVSIDHEMLTVNVDNGLHNKWARRDWDMLTARLAIEVLTLTGMRIGELAKVGIYDIDHGLRKIQILGKGNRERQVFFPDRVTSTRIRDYRQSAIVRFGKVIPDALLLNGLGRPATDQYLRRIIRIFAQNADLTKKVTPHMLRHTAATQLLEAGVDIRFVQKLLGHASITTTEIYTHVADHALRERISRVNIRKRLEMHR